MLVGTSEKLSTNVSSAGCSKSVWPSWWVSSMEVEERVATLQPEFADTVQDPGTVCRDGILISVILILGGHEFMLHLNKACFPLPLII